MIKKMDEMEMSITLRAVRWSWMYLIVCLGLWMLWETFYGDQWSLPAILLSSQFLVFYVAQQIMTMKTGDRRGRTNLLISCLVLFVSLAAGAFLLWTTK